MQADLRLAMQTARKAVSKNRSKAQDGAWERVWVPYLEDVGLEHKEFLDGIDDKIPYLQVLATRIRDGRASRSKKPVKAGTVRDEILQISKTFTELGAPDPRYNAHGDIDPRLRNLFKGMENEDGPPDRVKPCPIQVLLHALAMVELNPTPESMATLDMGFIGFFYLLRTGEHVKTSDNQPLRGKNVAFKVGNRKIDPFACPMDDLDRVTQSSIQFDTQKNRNKGEIIAHGRSGHSKACPSKTLARRINYIRQNGGNPSTPLCSFKRGNRWFTVSSEMLTNLLRTSVAMLPDLGIKPEEITARSLRAGGAMALLCGKVDTDTIMLVGRWRSDAMFRYLHAQALPIIRDLAHTMLHHGAYTLAPGAFEPPRAQRIIADADVAAGTL